MRWPAVQAATSPPTATAAQGDELFRRCLAHVLSMEGGYTDDPHDPGGPTYKGILLREFSEWQGVTLDAANTGMMKRALRAMPDETLAAIYYKRYWQPAQCALLPVPLALMHFDAAVNHGTGTAIRILQEAVGADADGEIGPQTLAAVRQTPAAEALERYAALRRRRYRALAHFWRFGRGWMNRVSATLHAANLMTEPTQSTTGETTMAKVEINSSNPATEPKWWGKSLTIWGVLITALSSVAPALGPVIGVDIPGELVRDAGGQAAATVQAITGLAGTLMAIAGRIRASQPLARRDLSIRL